jgi:aminobenzoyl-glutamate utilization protein B
MRPEKKALDFLKDNKTLLTRMAKDIWDHPQDGLEETYAAKTISDRLEEAGFSVQRGVGLMDTAFVGSWGEERPVIGILGEYDALPGLSQKVSSEREPIEKGGPGHGCGHNLLGVGSLGAALAVKETLEKNRVGGTVRYYGCPAEETLVGKVFMARDGVFDDLDAAITWHPFCLNTVWKSKTLAMNSFRLNFHGVEAHAAILGTGRSALDAAVLTEVGINHLRDNVFKEARIHGVITNGGTQPNIIPGYSQSWYYVRAPNREQVEEIYQKVLDIAKGSTLMSGTTFDVELLVGCHDFMSNDVISRVLLKNLKKIGPPEFTNEEKEFANNLIAKVSPALVQNALKIYKRTKEELGGPLCNKILDNGGGFAKDDLTYLSTEVGDVSYICPTGQFLTCCLPIGVGLHTWQAVAASGSTIGLKGMMLAAKTIALSALDLMLKPEILGAASERFKEDTGGRHYVSPLPESALPPVS